MDKTAIKKYAVWARQDLINRVKQKSYQYGITETGAVEKDADSVNGRLLSQAEKRQRHALLQQISENGFDHMIDEVAYTWFNRFCALRFMEVNGYLPSHIRVFTDEDNNFKPQILTEALNLSLPGLNIDKVYELKEDNRTEELYKYLLITQCNALNSILPGMFQRIEDYTELLFPDNLLREGSVIEQLVSQIPENDWKDAVQIIGWLYQFYNAERIEEINKKRIIPKNDIPAKTQFFTPDWIVRYMVENTLGKIWVYGHPDSTIKVNWKYYVDDHKQEDSVQGKLAKIYAEYSMIDPKDLKCIDPCMGSGHILVYMFDVLVQIYGDFGYSVRDAVQLIVRNNIYGLDLDERAAQLAYFAVMMKARQYDSRFFDRGVQPQIYAIQESNEPSLEVFDYIVKGDEKLRNELQKVVDSFKDAKEYGSILQVPSVDFELLYKRFDEIIDDVSLYKTFALDYYLPIVKQAEVLHQKYDVVVMNPPYLGVKKYNEKLSNFIEQYYRDYKYDLFSCFIIRAGELLDDRGYIGLLTQQTWLDVDSFEKLRAYIIENTSLKIAAHLGDNALDGGLGTIAFTYTKKLVGQHKTVFIDLTQYSYEDKSINLHNKLKQYIRDISDFNYIPKKIFSYKISEKILELFGEKAIKNYTTPKSGLVTRNNDLFLKFWYEVYYKNIEFQCDQVNYDKKWYPHAKGGSYRKWYGNYEYVVNWQFNGRDIREATKDAKGGSIVGSECYFHRGLSWSLSTFSNKFSMRILPENFIFNVEAPALFDVKNEEYFLALLNSKVGEVFLDIISDHLHYKKNDIGSVPYIYSDKSESRIAEIVIETVKNSKSDWDSFETSWDFKKHPLI